MKSKVLFIVQLPPPVHGASLVNKTLVESELVNKKYSIDVLQSQLAYSMQDMGRFSLKKLFNAILIIFKLTLKVIFKKYNLVYFTLSPLGFAFYKDAILVTIIKLFSNTKIVIHLHGKGIKIAAQSKFKKHIYKFVFKNIEVIQLAELLQADIKNVFEGKPYILPNGIISTQTKNYAQLKKENLVTFIYLSNLMKEKGVQLVLEATKKLQHLANHFQVYIVGPSADVTIQEVKQFLKENIISNTKVIGPVYGDEKYEYLLASDVFLLPTFYRNECFPLSILEAFQAGLAVISTENGAIPNMVKNKVNGFVIHQNNVEELTSKMKYLIENKTILSQIQSDNKIEFKNKYTEEIFTNNFITIIDDILKK